MNQVHKRNGKKLKVSRPTTPSIAKWRNGFDERDKLVGDLELQLTRMKMQEEELLHAQQAIEDVAHYYASLFDSAPVGYMVLNSAGMILDINQAGAYLMGRRVQDIKGKPLTLFLPGEQVSPFLEHLRRCRTIRGRN